MRRAYAVGCLLLLGTVVIFAGSFFLWATRPIATEAQIQEAAARVERARGERVTSCPRPVLRGVALPGDGAEGLRELANARGPFLGCYEFIGANVQEVSDVFLVHHSMRRPTWRLANSPQLEIERRAAAECAGLDTAVRALLQRESGCTAHPLLLPERDVPDFMQIEWAMFILARARMHEGRLQEAIEVVLDVMRLGQDLSRGRASLVPVRVGLQLQAEAAQQLEALLASDLPWTPTMLDELARQARVLASSGTEPTDWFRHHEIWLAEHALDQLHGPATDVWGEQALVDIATADYAGLHWPDCTGPMCIARYQDAIVEGSREVAERGRFARIPGFEQGTRVRFEYVNRLREREHSLSTAAHNEALLRALPALFLHRRMSLSGTCPTAQALQAEARAAGLPDVEVQSSTEPHQPMLLRTAGQVEPLYRAHCPALREGDEAQP